jgi:hypothetical protein
MPGDIDLVTEAFCSGVDVTGNNGNVVLIDDFLWEITGAIGYNANGHLADIVNYGISIKYKSIINQ